MSEKREQKHDAKRSRILAAATHAFSRNGYHQTRISDIAKAANVADGTVYLYFDGKKDLLSRIFEEHMSRSLQRGRDELERIDGAVARLQRIIEVHLEDLGANPELATVFQIELRHSAGFMELYSRGHLRDYFQLIAEIIEQGQREGTVRSDIDPWFATKCIFGVLDEAATNWILSKKNYRLHADTKPILDFVLNGLSDRSN